MNQSAFEQLQAMTTLVADTGDLKAIQQFKPLDATTNPSLITAAAKLEENRYLLEQAFQQARTEGLSADALIERSIDILTVKLGVEILNSIQGRVSTEVDAALSYDSAATVAKAKQLLTLYHSYGVDQDRILIKIAATWEGIQAAKQLESEGIHCNLTLILGMHQAHACADAKVTLISPFVGRILDWHKKHHQRDHYAIQQDPGVCSVKEIYAFYKQHDISTEIMGASFRSLEQVLALAGCDLLTVSPALLAELSASQQQVERQLNAEHPSQIASLSPLSETTFQQQLQDDLMASQLLQSGIQGFIQAREQLQLLLTQSFAVEA